MKPTNNHMYRSSFSSVLVKFAVCFLLLSLAYRLFSSSFPLSSPVAIHGDETVLNLDKKLPPQVAEPPENVDDVSADLDGFTSRNGPQNCMRNGRPDSDYIYWQWKPRDCGLPRFDPKKFLKIMKHKSLAFIGDSIMRNHVQSLLCLLSQAELAVEVYHDEPYRNRKWSFPSHNFTVSVIWSPFLAKASIFEDENGVSSNMIQLHLDELDSVWTQQYDDFNYIMIAGGKWFLKSAIYYENNTVVGCHNCHNNNITQLGFIYAYRKALNSTLKFITSSKHKPYIFIRTTTPDHFENGQWNTGGYCNRTRPFQEGEVEINDTDGIMRSIELEEFERGEAVGLENGLIMKLFDTTVLSLLRPDGHPGAYRQVNPYEGKDKNAKIQNDCLHWCLPGPIDSWNGLMMEMVRRGTN
ncbi:protein trichome birefringence-like 26 isoform X2 [Henckelia pumila]|uniref:protein trichome birefringence-like 26 isoform X2 n=1 Tax=Henckelia pumila TaxID=405737 RepID=UPI003C6E3398